MAHRPGVVTPDPTARRAAATLWEVGTPSAIWGCPREAAACLGSPKATPISKKSAAPKKCEAWRCGPQRPVRKSSLEHKPGLGCPLHRLGWLGQVLPSFEGTGPGLVAGSA